LRLSETARDAQQIIDAAVKELLDGAVSANASADQVIIDCGAAARANRHLVRELFVAIWRDRGWPQQAMGFAEWNALAEMVVHRSREAPQRILPGQIAAQKTGEQLSLARLR
jgi:hypothetical protein